MVYEQSRRSITESARSGSEAEIARREGDNVLAYLSRAQTTLRKSPAIPEGRGRRTTDDDLLESLLFSEVLNNPGISEVTFTHAESSAPSPAVR